MELNKHNTIHLTTLCGKINKLMRKHDKSFTFTLASHDISSSYEKGNIPSCKVNTDVVVVTFDFIFCSQIGFWEFI